MGISPVHNEVATINNTKFLAELGKLLTFMEEKDRQETLALYEAMFREAEDEEALSALLVSPTRQAVLNARAYNAGEKPEAGKDPAHIAAVKALRQEAEDRGILGDRYLPIPASAPAKEPESVPEMEQFTIFSDEPETVSPKEADAPAEDEAPAEELPPEGQISLFTAEEKAAAVESLRAENESAPVPPAEETVVPAQTEDAEDEPVTVAKPRVLLLILYVLIAVPVTLAGLAVLLVPSFACLGAAGVLGFAGAAAGMTALGGVPMVANLLVILGVAVILLALGLLFLWAFIWLVGGVMVSFVSAVIDLGRKWCYKEVQIA